MGDIKVILFPVHREVKCFQVLLLKLGTPLGSALLQSRGAFYKILEMKIIFYSKYAFIYLVNANAACL